mmetsp:Transcript_5906/g.15711  ORF Transcript_5906/g.15711 Transcript_5906/m.15711 type:complete len:305 (-) Transcript_5906:934-1848(-)
MVVHDVQYHAPALLVQSHDHFSALSDPCSSIRVACIRAVRYTPMHWIVAPVESVLVSHGKHRCLLLVAVRRVLAQILLNLQLLLLPLRHRAKVIQRQQVDMIQTRLTQLCKVCQAATFFASIALLHALRVKRQVLATQVRGHALISNAEITDVQLIQGDVSPLFYARDGMLVPALWYQTLMLQICGHDPYTLPVCRKATCIGVSGLADLMAERPRAPHLEPELVVSPPAGPLWQVHTPHASTQGIPGHGHDRGLSAVWRCEVQQLHGLGSGRPDCNRVRALALIPPASKGPIILEERVDATLHL